MALIEDGDLPQKVVAQLEDDQLTTMLAGLNAKASRVAPCLKDTTDEGLIAEAKLILMGVVSRWAEAGAGAFTQKMETTGPMTNMVTVDTKQRTGYNLWPSEIAQLQDLCRTAGTSAFTVDTAPSVSGEHAPWCAVNFGALYCSCGADIAGFPIFEQG